MLDFAKACLEELKPDDYDESNSESEAHSDSDDVSNSEDEAPSDSEDGDYVDTSLKKPATKVKTEPRAKVPTKVKTKPRTKAATKPTFEEPSPKPLEMKSNENLQRNLEHVFNIASPCMLKVGDVMRPVGKIGDYNAKEDDYILASLTECNGIYKAGWIQKKTNKASGISTYQRSENWCCLEEITFC
jgi:hypothetical protein